MSHFDYEQFLRQRGLAAPKRQAAAPSRQATPPLGTTATPQASSAAEDEFFDYDVPTCDWRPGTHEAFCGEGVICPPCG